MFVFTDKYQRSVTQIGAPYWRFNVYVEEDDFSFISVGWSYRNDKTQAPYQVIGGKFYTTLRISRKIAQAIYKDVIVKVGELEGRKIQYNDKNWRSPIIGQTSFLKTLPEYYSEKYGPIPGQETADDITEEIASNVVSIAMDKSPYPDRLTFEQMNDPSVRPSYIPPNATFDTKDCHALTWGAREWAAYIRSETRKQLRKTS